MSISTVTSLISSNIKILKEKDFFLNSREGISYVYDDPTLILFYDGSNNSAVLQPIFLQTASSVGNNPVFAAVNLKTEGDVSSKLGMLRLSVDHPFHWVGLATPPFIVVYRWGWPQAFYNGEYSPESLKNYALKLAGQPGYKEQVYERDPLKPLEVVSGAVPSGAFVSPPVVQPPPVTQPPPTQVSPVPSTQARGPVAVNIPQEENPKVTRLTKSTRSQR